MWVDFILHIDIVKRAITFWKYKKHMLEKKLIITVNHIAFKLWWNSLKDLIGDNDDALVVFVEKQEEWIEN